MDYSVQILFLFCHFWARVASHHQFPCGQDKLCYTETEICLRGNCVPICVDDADCEQGDICHEKHKVG